MIGIENSNIVVVAKNRVREKNLEAVVKIIKGKAEDIDLEPLGVVGMVDIIISKWMGYCLFHKCVLDQVIFARNKWLRPFVMGGMMFPDRATLWVCGIEEWQVKYDKIRR